MSITDNVIPTQAPRQPDAEQCGYFVMRFMRQIIHEYRPEENTPLRSTVNSFKIFIFAYLKSI